ncbi:MAG: fasciclin domain-containing protein [Anaerolineae bacterium]|jgi:uncharacterized surface protein with fasciclin (FAS1) repeats|nr:fasciclin domain-containing protein [Anaerolineae bacterium]
MRKLSLLLVVLLLAVFPVFAQDEEPTQTIAEIVLASTEAETPEFTVLAAALGVVDPIFAETLAGEGSYTVFAPTDAAFTALLEELGVTADDLLADTVLLEAVLLYHIVPFEFSAEQLLPNAGAYLGTSLPGYAVMITETGVDQANVVMADVMATNGTVHVIDAVLVPDMSMEEDMDMATEEPMEEPMEEPTQSIAEIVVASTEAETPEFTTLLAAVGAADESVLALLSGENGAFTVFAPTDAAFAGALTELGVEAADLLADSMVVTGILAYHVIPGAFMTTDFARYADMSEEGVIEFVTLTGDTLEISAEGVNGLTVSAFDIAATNGVIHVIDGVLLPAEEE